ncbi:hypothetical protein [Brevundimonas sp. M20]|uniref:hypothetical protein n=1 Tax=Brevundimonas sp. M20 TaxID=2591463 RepID=UPI001146D0E5|nr:hypothetical protein [Brevundimonas sp. M20]QDH72089.1 hypothetical protein FKQ52_00830 [Brevundimonas sp. M20]
MAEIVTLEAWHEKFDGATERADLHVNVAFTAGRIGGKATDKVRFRLMLKQAEVVIVIPPSEPAKVDPRSVRRDTRAREGVATQTRETDLQGSTTAGGKLKLGASGVEAGLDFDASAAASAKAATSVIVTEALREMMVVHGLDEDGTSHRWTITPAIGDELVGQPWRSEEEPRLTVVDMRVDRDRHIPPSIRVEVRCRREDLIITDIVMTDEAKWSVLQLNPQHRNRMAAAEAYLRNRLFEERLLEGADGDMSNPFARMTLAVVLAESL